MLRRAFLLWIALFCWAALLTTTASAQDIFAEVKLNGVPTGLTVRFDQVGGSMSLSLADLKILGLATPEPNLVSPSGMVALADLKGVEYDLDEASQTIAISADLRALARKSLDPSRSAPKPSPAALGALLNYSVYADAQQGQHNIGSTLETRVFGPAGALSTTFAVQSNAASGSRDVARLDTTWVYEQPEKFSRLAIGDFVSTGPSWATPVRAAGISLTTDYSLQPQFVTSPMPHLSGSDSVPSTVSLYLNGVQRLSTTAQAGNFDINQLPVVNGQGDVSMVVKDVLGRETVQTFSFYGSQELLRSGLTSYALEAGALRIDAYTADDHYADGFASLAVRQGLTDTVTGEFRAAASQAVQELGVGVVTKVDEFAIVSGAINGSQSDGKTGAQIALAARHESGPLSLYLSVQQSIGRFRDLAVQEGAAVIQRSVQAGLSWSMKRAGNFSLSYTSIKNTQSDTAVIALGWSQTFAGRFTLSANIFRSEQGQEDTTGTIAITIPFSRSGVASANVTAGTHSAPQEQAFASQAPPTDGGWGWRSQAQVGQTSMLQAGIEHDGQIGQAGVDVSVSGGVPAVQAYGSGSVVWMGDRPRLAAHIGDGFALIETGLPNVEVTVENRKIGRTGPDGAIFVPDLPAYVTSRVGIDPGSVPLEDDIRSFGVSVTPRRSMGTRAKMPISASRAAMVHIIDGRGRALALGSVIQLETGSKSVIGYDGVAYLTGLASLNHATVMTSDGECDLSFRYSPVKGYVPEVGPVVCNMH